MTSLNRRDEVSPEALDASSALAAGCELLLSLPGGVPRQNSCWKCTNHRFGFCDAVACQRPYCSVHDILCDLCFFSYCTEECYTGHTCSPPSPDDGMKMQIFVKTQTLTGKTITLDAEHRESRATRLSDVAVTLGLAATTSSTSSADAAGPPRAGADSVAGAADTSTAGAIWAGAISAPRARDAGVKGSRPRRGVKKRLRLVIAALEEEASAQVPEAIAAPHPAGASRPRRRAGPRRRAEVVVPRGLQNDKKEFLVASAFGSTSDEEEAFVARLCTRWCDTDHALRPQTFL